MICVAERTPLARDIRTLRESLRLTQAEMADRLDVDRATYKNWEYGQSRPPEGKLVVLNRMGLGQEVTGPTIPAGEIEIPIPYIGTMSASEHVNWTDPFESEEMEFVPGHMGDARGRFACRVASDCMMPLLEPGDVCVWQKSDIPRIGCVVLFRTEDQLVSIKQLKHDGTGYYLHPLNPSYEDVRVGGRPIAYLVGIVRRIGKRTITDYDSDGIRP